jgi:hypothetical protein
VKTVDSAFTGFHTDLEHLRKDAKTDAARSTLESGDRLLAQIRQDAVKAIHATNPCAKNDDEDKDNDQDEDKDSEKHSQTNFVLALFQKLFGKSTTVTVVTASPTPSASPVPTVAPTATPSASPSSGVTFSGTDPKAIADQAVAAMKLVFDDTKAQLPTTTAAPNTPKDRPFSPRPSRRPEPSHGSERD